MAALAVTASQLRYEATLKIAHSDTLKQQIEAAAIRRYASISFRLIDSIDSSHCYHSVAIVITHLLPIHRLDRLQCLPPQLLMSAVTVLSASVAKMSAQTARREQHTMVHRLFQREACERRHVPVHVPVGGRCRRLMPLRRFLEML
jgi:hypothetical protein